MEQDKDGKHGKDKKDKKDKHDKKDKDKHDKKDKKDKHDKKHKHDKKDKKHKHDKKDKHDKDKKHSKKDKHRKHDQTSIEGSKPITGMSSKPITEDDYFQKNTEFRVWLKMNNRSFEQLSSEEARALFGNRFVVAYNSGSLPPFFYSGNIPVELREASIKSNHNWNMRIDAETQQRLTETVDSIFHSNHSTNTSNSNNNNNNNTHQSRQSHEKGDDHRGSSAKRKAADRVLERLVEEKPIGREAVLDARRTIADKIHSSHKEKEEEGGLGSFSEGFLMGDDGSDLQRMKRLKVERDQKRHDAGAKRLQELQDKESYRMKAFMNQVGLGNTGIQTKIVIPPRE